MGPLLLVVDDDPVIRRTIADVIEDRGYPVLSADDAEQALQVMRGHPELALVIADIVMPGASGLELAEVARRDERLKGIPIVLMTAASSVPVPVGIPHIAKPFSLDTFLTFVEDHLRSEPSSDAEARP